VSAKKKEKQKPSVVQNKKARHRFQIQDTFEAGIVLSGNEVKSLRSGQISLDESYARLSEGELFLVDCHIAPYGKTGFDRPEPKRDRKLLIKRAEIRKLTPRVLERGYTLVPLRVYFKGPWAKVEIALARGKDFADRREDIKKRSQKRDIDRVLAGRRRGRKGR
jgi:SsrA-binding protein